MPNEYSQICVNPGWDYLKPSLMFEAYELEKEYGIKYTGDGWYNETDNWMFIHAGENWFHIWIWKGTDPRTHLARIAEAEVRVFAGVPV